MLEEEQNSGTQTAESRRLGIQGFAQFLKRFGYFLKLRGLSLTRERQQILEKICDLSGRFTVDDLFFALHAAGRRISKATIYRTVQLLLECRIIRETPLGARQGVYELADAGHYHGHMVCQHCHRLIEFGGPTLERFVHEASVSHQFLPLSAQIKFLGFCNECVKANPPALREQTCVPFLKYAQSREGAEPKPAEAPEN